MKGDKIPDDVRQKAIAEYENGAETIAAVAARHGIARSTLGCWVGSRGQIAYTGGWDMTGLVKRPLIQVRRP